MDQLAKQSAHPQWLTKCSTTKSPTSPIGSGRSQQVESIGLICFIYRFLLFSGENLTIVRIGMTMRHMAEYEDTQSTFNVQTVFNLRWTDHRLMVDVSENECAMHNVTLQGNEWHYARLWKPNLRISNNKDPNVLNSASTQVTHLRINYLGEVRVSLRSVVH